MKRRVSALLAVVLCFGAISPVLIRAQVRVRFAPRARYATPAAAAPAVLAGLNSGLKTSLLPRLSLRSPALSLPTLSRSALPTLSPVTSALAIQAKPTQNALPSQPKEKQASLKNLRRWHGSESRKGRSRSRRWSGLFDGAFARRKSGGDPAPKIRAREHKRLGALARPFRTRRQLRRLDDVERGAEEPFEFAVIGDAEPGRISLRHRALNRTSPVLESLLHRIAGIPVDFVIQLGDVVTRATVRNFLTFFRTLLASGLKHPFLTIIGNHDRHKPHGQTPSDLYRSIFGKTNYSFDRGGARFIILDNSNGRLTQAQLRWLDRKLQTEKRKLVFLHIPPITPEIIAVTSKMLRFAGFRKGAEDFVRIVSERKADRVYMGHVHGFGVAELGGVRYVLSGGGGSPMWRGLSSWLKSIHHFITVRVSPEGIRETVHTLDGETFDIDEMLASKE